jgi:hypothetical protein
MFAQLKKNMEFKYFPSVKGVLQYCARCPFQEVQQIGRLIQQNGGVVLDGRLCKKITTMVLAIMAVLRGLGERRTVRFLERKMRAWIRITDPCKLELVFVVHPCTREIVKRIRFDENKGTFSRLKKLRLFGPVFTQKGFGRFKGKKESVVAVQLEDGSVSEFNLDEFYFLPREHMHSNDLGKDSI